MYLRLDVWNGKVEPVMKDMVDFTVAGVEKEKHTQHIDLVT